MAVSTARAGNVIGGGDFASDRIIPDCIRATIEGKDIVVRNPYSTRPYQHVLEPLYAYLMIAAMQYQDGRYAGWYNGQRCGRAVKAPVISALLWTGRLRSFCQLADEIFIFMKC